MRWSAVVVAVFFMPQTPAAAQYAADAYYDSEVMRAAREALHEGHGSGITAMIFGERLEYQSNEGDPTLVWEAQGWIGGDINRFWLKSEGEYLFEHSDFEEFELQALYSRAIHPHWNLQAGLRHDFKPDPTRSYAVVGLQGTAPYWFEIDGALFISNKGDVSARLETEYEFRLTQKLMLQPRVELNAAFSDDVAIGVGAGLSTMQLGLRLRYEVVREIAPYIGVSWSRSLGSTADLLGDNAESTSLVAGIRFWF